MITAKFNPKLSTRKIWAGLYGGHLDFIVFFSKKPKPNKDGETVRIHGGEPGAEAVYYDCYDDQNKPLLMGDMHLGDFLDHFPGVDLSQYLRKNGMPKATEIPEVFQIEITAPFYKNDLYSVDFHCEGRL